MYLTLGKYISYKHSIKNQFFSKTNNLPRRIHHQNLKLRLSFKQIICPKKCLSINDKANLKIMESWDRVISFKTSYDYLIRKMNEFDKIKKIMLSEGQILLFDNLPDENLQTQLEKIDRNDKKGLNNNKKLEEFLFYTSSQSVIIFLQIL